MGALFDRLEDASVPFRKTRRNLALGTEDELMILVSEADNGGQTARTLRRLSRPLWFV